MAVPHLPTPLFKGILGKIEGFFQILFQVFWRDLQYYGEVIANGLAGGFKKSIGTEKPGFLDYMSRGLVEQGLLEEGDVAKMQETLGATGIYTNLFVLANIIILIFKSIFLKSDILSSGYIQKLNDTFKPALPGINEIIRAGFVAPEKNEQIRSIAHRYGLKDEDIDLLYLSNYAVYPIELVKVLSLRGFLDEQKTYEAMRELGFTDTRTENIIKTWQVLPGPQDLFWMVAKEAFEEDIIKHIGLDDEFPAAQVEFLTKQGVSEEWARKYWYAHWDTPSIGQGFEMIHRGVVNFSELDMLFRNAEIPPFWRDKLTKIAYRPLTRVDIRRIRAANVIDVEDLYKGYLDLGYNPENAAIMTEWTEIYNQDENKTLAKSQVMGAYEKRAITEEYARELLKELRYTADQITFMIVMADYKDDLDIQDELIANIKDRYLVNLDSKTATQTKLNKLNLPGRRIDALLARWETLVYKSRKLPSKDDLKKFYFAKIIDADTFQIELERLGYSFRSAKMYVDLAKKGKK